MPNTVMCVFSCKDVAILDPKTTSLVPPEIVNDLGKFI